MVRGQQNDRNGWYDSLTLRCFCRGTFVGDTISRNSDLLSHFLASFGYVCNSLCKCLRNAGNESDRHFRSAEMVRGDSNSVDKNKQ